MILQNAPLSGYTRFGLGGPARTLVDALTPVELADAWNSACAAGNKITVIGGGSNLVASDEGFAGTVLRYVASELTIDGNVIRVDAGCALQTLVDASIDAGLEGLHTMTGIPGWVGGAVYGNAGAYGHSIHEFVESVQYLDTATGKVEEIGNAACEFHYRESVFKQRKDWIVLNTSLRLPTASDPIKIRAEADRILKIRNEKYPPDLKCAGSIFKNLFLAELPQDVQGLVPKEVIREGKVPSAYFLEQVGAKGMFAGDIRVADYHANLIYNTGTGTAAQVRHLVGILKERVLEHFGIELEEEVQYV